MQIQIIGQFFDTPASRGAGLLQPKLTIGRRYDALENQGDGDSRSALRATSATAGSISAFSSASGLATGSAPSSVDIGVSTTVGLSMCAPIEEVRRHYAAGFAGRGPQ